jgi:hypothetical protein
MILELAYTSSQRYGFWSAYESDPGSFTDFGITEIPGPSVAWPVGLASSG